MNYRPAVEDEQTRSVTDPAAEVTAVRVELFTGDVLAAGTDAGVFLRLGERTFPLKGEPGADPFERGALDAFALALDPPMKLAGLREIEIEVYHDDEGRNPGWHLVMVKLWVTLTSRPGEELLYKRWTDIGWLAVDEAPFVTQVTLQAAG